MSDLNPSEPDKDIACVNRAILDLRRNFDTVQVFAIRHSDKEGTVRVTKGSGDYFSRYGHAKLWCDNQKLCEPEETKDED